MSLEAFPVLPNGLEASPVKTGKLVVAQFLTPLPQARHYQCSIILRQLE
jgi:hypothetical protein